MRAGDHDAAVEGLGKGGVIDLFGTAHADVRHGAAGFAQAKAKGIAQERPGQTRVPSDDGMARAGHGHKGTSGRPHELRGKRLRHSAAHVIGLEAVKFTHCASLWSAEGADGGSVRP